MPFDLDEKVDLTRAREITLGARTLKVAPLSMRQIIKSTAMLPQIGAADSTEKSLDLLVDFVMLGLARTYPTLTRDEFLDSEMTAPQLREAADVIILQAGGRKAEAGDGVAGEA
jgi:hypothetical protein